MSEFGMRGLHNLHAADLTKQALELAQKRLDAYGLTAQFSQQNVESMTFASAEFDHVNCQGVIHHPPNMEAAVEEIAHVIKPDATASVSVHYRNSIIKMWPYVRWLGWHLAKLGGGLKGYGREKIFLESNVDEIILLYDSSDNQIGKSYTKMQFTQMLQKHFDMKEAYLHLFPARSLPFKIPARLHRWLDKKLGFMIYATLQKQCAA